MTIEVQKNQQDSAVLSEESYFDKFGRCLPADLDGAVHHQTRRYFQLTYREIDLAQSYARLDAAFNVASSLTLEGFEQSIERLLANLAADPRTEAILNGVAVPIILPKAQYQDMGEALEATYLPAVDAAYHSVFPEYSFTNHAPHSLKGELTVTPDSRHERLLEKMTKDFVVGLYFPCMLEYSVPAAIEQIGHMPDRFLLAGGVDTAAAFISMPSLLFREDGYPPLLWLSGLTAKEENVGYHFEAYGYDLTFNRRVHLNNVAEYWASGITVIE